VYKSKWNKSDTNVTYTCSWLSFTVNFLVTVDLFGSGSTDRLVHAITACSWLMNGTVKLLRVQIKV